MTRTLAAFPESGRALASAQLPNVPPPDPLAMRPTLLVPLDGSGFAECALPVALAIAEATGARVELASVVSPLPLEPELGAHARAESFATYLEEVEDDLGAQGATGVSASVLYGPTHHALLAHAAAIDAQLLVMATHGRGPISRFWLGSVADAVARRARIPLLLVRPWLLEEARPTGRPSFRNILVPVSGHDETDAVVERAIHFGEPFGASYTLVHVVHPDAELAALEQSAEACDAVGMTRDGAERALARVAARIRRRGLQVAEEVVVDPDVAHGILSGARMAGADLVAMSTHRRGSLERLLIGSVAHKLVRMSEVPVLLCREEEVEP